MQQSATTTRTLCAALVTFLVVALLFQFFDQPLSEAAYSLRGTLWHTAAKHVSLAADNLFVKSLVASGIVIAAFDALRNGTSRRTSRLFYICLSVASAMLVGDVLKELFGRARPPLWFESGIYGFFPMAGDYMHHSFPSGHTLRIFSSMAALAHVFPAIRVPALSVAVLVGISRVLALKHYPSDVLLGAFIGTTAAVWGWRILVANTPSEN